MSRCIISQACAAVCRSGWSPIVQTDPHYAHVRWETLGAPGIVSKSSNYVIQFHWRSAERKALFHLHKKARCDCWKVQRLRHSAFVNPGSGPDSFSLQCCLRLAWEVHAVCLLLVTSLGAFRTGGGLHRAGLSSRFEGKRIEISLKRQTCRIFVRSDGVSRRGDCFQQLW